MLSGVCHSALFNIQGGDILNPKLQKVNKEIERAKTKIAELQASLPSLEEEKTRLENDEVIKVFRSADVAPADFTAFIEAYAASRNAGARQSVQPAPKPNTLEDKYNEDEV
jgi:DNA repair exonuclease SbcCD ATPase subunit